MKSNTAPTLAAPNAEKLKSWDSDEKSFVGNDLSLPLVNFAEELQNHQNQ
jgi:hypothetical protein